ncbi:MAG TPA: chemotaxis protein CheW [Nostocaceae cyanobacterium]|nr:chemotaxis protein CheW [Nostocaceae cyanobacterium]
MDNSRFTTSIKPKINTLTDSYLKFQLNRQTGAVVAVKYTQEAIIVPVEAVTTMPNMPACILGLMNWRSRVIWVIDLPKMFNLECLDHRIRQYNVIVIKVESQLLGLVVQEIKGTAKFTDEDIGSPVGQVASSLVPYLCGCVVQQEEILLVLDAVSIIKSATLRSD